MAGSTTSYGTDKVENVDLLVRFNSSTKENKPLYETPQNGIDNILYRRKMEDSDGDGILDKETEPQNNRNDYYRSDMYGTKIKVYNPDHPGDPNYVYLEYTYWYLLAGDEVRVTRAIKTGKLEQQWYGFYTSRAYSYESNKLVWFTATGCSIVENYKEKEVDKVTSEEQQKAKDEYVNSQTGQTYTEEQAERMYEEYINSEYKDISTNSQDRLLINNLNGVYGIPYQFPESVDPKPDGSVFGTIYTERILERMSLLIMSPGKVDYMTNYDGEKRSVLDALVATDSGDSTDINRFISKPGKYYTFAYANNDYWAYVNSMNSACAAYLGIEDIEVNINGTTGALASFKWENACNSKFDTFLLSSESYVAFYVDAETSEDESFSNDTTQSNLASTVNEFSDIAKEIQFILGSQTGASLKWLDSENIDAVNKAIEGIAQGYLGGSKLFTDIAKEFATVASGGKLIFPEIWQDSSFSKSLTAKMKFRCPCPNKLNWFLDICVPINHLIAFTLPRTPRGKNILGNSYDEYPTANGYVTPFLVRAFYKGLFNCDMGIITDLSLSKGKEGSWTVDGLPTEVDVDLTIKDLYNVMAMTPQDQSYEFMANTTFLNYMANSCGISINKPDMDRSLTLWGMTKYNKWKDRLTGYNFWKQLTTNSQNTLYDFYKGIFQG